MCFFLHVLGKIYKLRLKLSHRDFMYMPVTKKKMKFKLLYFKLIFFLFQIKKVCFKTNTKTLIHASWINLL